MRIYQSVKAVFAVAFCIAVLAFAVGCSTDKECATGGEGCACTPGGSCDPGLNCLSKVCVNPNAPDASTTEGDTSTTEGDTSTPKVDTNTKPDSAVPGKCKSKFDCPDTYICRVFSSTSGHCELGRGVRCRSKTGECEKLKECGTTTCSCKSGAAIKEGSCYRAQYASPACTSDAKCLTGYTCIAEGMATGGKLRGLCWKRMLR